MVVSFALGFGQSNFMNLLSVEEELRKFSLFILLWVGMFLVTWVDELCVDVD